MDALETWAFHAAAGKEAGASGMRWGVSWGSVGNLILTGNCPFLRELAEREPRDGLKDILKEWPQLTKKRTESLLGEASGRNAVCLPWFSSSSLPNTLAEGTGEVKGAESAPSSHPNATPGSWKRNWACTWMNIGPRLTEPKEYHLSNWNDSNDSCLRC